MCLGFGLESTFVCVFFPIYHRRLTLIHVGIDRWDISFHFCVMFSIAKKKLWFFFKIRTSSVQDSAGPTRSLHLRAPAAPSRRPGAAGPARSLHLRPRRRRLGAGARLVRPAGKRAPPSVGSGSETVTSYIYLFINLNASNFKWWCRPSLTPTRWFETAIRSPRREWKLD